MHTLEQEYRIISCVFVNVAGLEEEVMAGADCGGPRHTVRPKMLYCIAGGGVRVRQRGFVTEGPASLYCACPMAGIR